MRRGGSCHRPPRSRCGRGQGPCPGPWIDARCRGVLVAGGRHVLVHPPPGCPRSGETARQQCGNICLAAPCRGAPARPARSRPTRQTRDDAPRRWHRITQGSVFLAPRSPHARTRGRMTGQARSAPVERIRRKFRAGQQGRGPALAAGLASVLALTVSRAVARQSVLARPSAAWSHVPEEERSCIIALLLAPLPWRC